MLVRVSEMVVIPSSKMVVIVSSVEDAMSCDSSGVEVGVGVGSVSGSGSGVDDVFDSEGDVS